MLQLRNAKNGCLEEKQKLNTGRIRRSDHLLQIIASDNFEALKSPSSCTVNSTPKTRLVVLAVFSKKSMGSCVF